MIKTNQETVVEIKKIIEANDGAGDCVRVYLAGMGCSGPSFGLALDEHKDNDESFVFDGQEFVMQKDFYDEFGSFIIEYQDGGYLVEPEALAGMPSACGSCTGCN